MSVNLKKYGSFSGTQVMEGIWDINYRLGVGTSTPDYPVDIVNNVQSKSADTLTFKADTTGSTFNSSAGPLTNTCAYFGGNATKLPGGFNFINIGVMGSASGGDSNFGIATSNASYLGVGYFYQSNNYVTLLQGGPSTDNISFGPDNVIRMNATAIGINGVLAVQTTPASDAYLQVGPGNSVIGQLRLLTGGTLMSAATSGVIEYDGNHFYGTVGSFRYQLENQVVVTARTTNYNILTSDTGKYFTNEGAGGTVRYTLPSAQINLIYSFIVRSANNLQISATSGNNISIAGTINTANSISASTTATTVTLLAINSHDWVATNVIGTWS